MEARSLSNQQAMEQALGKLVMDGGFRDAFFLDSAVAIEAAGSHLRIASGAPWRVPRRQFSGNGLAL